MGTLRLPDGLTVRERRFVDEFTVDLNAAASVRRVYNFTDARRVQNYASKLLGKPHVRAAIVERIQDLARKTDLDARRVIDGLCALAFHDIRDAAVWDGDTVVLRSSEDIPDSVAFAIKSISNTDNGVKVTFHDRMRPLHLLGQYLGLWPAGRVELTGVGGGPVQVSAYQPQFERYSAEARRAIWEIVEREEERLRDEDEHEARRVVDVGVGR